MRPVREAFLDLMNLRCPRCAGQLVLRVLADERGRGVHLTLDSACIACGVSPWAESDQRGAPRGGGHARRPHAGEARHRAGVSRAVHHTVQ
jgi:hypothetical protein